MSLLLCRQENVKHPYYVKDLGIHIYSSQELSYVIYNHPLLAMDELVDERLLTFLRDELNQGFLALKMERWMAAKEDPDELLIMILQECEYYTAPEITKFRQQIVAIRKKHPADYGKQKADELFTLKQYGKAQKHYKELLDYPEDSFVDQAFQGRIWNNLASCYARMLQPQKAMEAYEKAYAANPQVEILCHMYCLGQLYTQTKLAERFQILLTDEMKSQWESLVQDAQNKVEDNEELIQLEELFAKDSIRRNAGELELLGKWKRQYRSSI